MRCASVTVFGIGVVGALWAAPALAGPWAREAGDVFVSLQVAAEQSPAEAMVGLWEPETYLSAYGEVGLGRSLTLGVDLGGGETTRQAVGFVRYTITAPDATWQVAVDAGGGLRQVEVPVFVGPSDTETETTTLLRLGASIGRGFGGGGDAWYMPMRHEGGWTNLDLTALYDLDRQDTILQGEATVGFTLSERFSAIFQVKAEDWPGADLLVSATPSIVFQIRPGTSVRLGARAAVTGSDDIGLTLSLWQEF